MLSIQHVSARIYHAKRIAITIDDAPSPSTPLFTGQQRALSIIDAMSLILVPSNYGCLGWRVMPSATIHILIEV
jgi:hypothetical protein